MRASDSTFEAGLVLGGHRQEDAFWQQTLSRLATYHGRPDTPVETKFVCVDKKRQWSKWRNVWHSSAIRTTIYLLGTPVRALLGRRHPVN